MDMKNFDYAALNHDLKELAMQQERGWWRRNRLWFVPVVLLALILAGGAAAYWALFAKVYNLDTFRSAMQKIEASPDLQRELGQPIKVACWPPPSQRLESGEREIRWDVQGQKARAKAHILSRLMMGNWETIILEVVLPDGKKIPLLDEGGTAADAPAFQSVRPESKKPETNAPAPEINLQIPTDDAPSGTK